MVHTASVVPRVDGRPLQALAILRGRCWATYLQAKQHALVALWFEAAYAVEAARCQCALTVAQRHEVRLRTPLPPNLPGVIR